MPALFTRAAQPAAELVHRRSERPDRVYLLPHTCHLNYPRLAPIMRATCEEFGVRYTSYATWREAFACHWRELRLLGRPGN